MFFYRTLSCADAFPRIIVVQEQEGHISNETRDRCFVGKTQGRKEDS